MLNQIILVGMRYMDAANIKVVEKLHKQGISVDVQLRTEKNTSGVDGTALAAYVGDIKVAYVRNKDIPFIIKDFSQYNYCISRINTNYWIIISGLKSIINPCKEIPLDTNTAEKYWHDQIEEYVPLDSSKITVKINSNQTKENKMNVTSNMRDSFFREVKNVAIDIQSGKFGVVSADGISVYAEGGIAVNPITELGIKFPAFAMRVSVKDLKEGDIVINGNESSFFKRATDNGYEVVNLSGEVKQIGTVSNMFFGKNSVLAVKNMFGEGTNPMMMALLMGDEGFAGGDNKKMMLAMAMSGGFGGGDMGSMNPLMLMLMLGK